MLHWRKNEVVERVDCRSFKERGIDEQPTIHEGVAARIMEQRGIISERCEMNRQIKADNKILRELKALVAKLTEAVKNTVPVIAEKLEDIQSRLIINRYQLRFNNSQLEQIGEQKKVVSSFLQRYDKLKKNLHTKRNRLKKLKAEKQSVNPINFIKHNQLDKQIDELTAETENQKSQYAEVRESIPPEDSEAVRSERRSICDGIIAKAARLLQSTYGRKYSGDMLTEVENEIDTDLNEMPFEKRSLKEQLKEQSRNTQSESKNKRREYER